LIPLKAATVAAAMAFQTAVAVSESQGPNAIIALPALVNTCEKLVIIP